MADDDLILLRRHSFSQPTPPKLSSVNQARPRRFSTVATCHRPDRVVDTEPNLDNFPAPGLVAAPRYYYQPETLPVEISQSLLSRRRHRTVVIVNLPRTLVDIRDVLCRVRGGGPLAHCFLTTGPGSSGARERLVILTFEKSADAQRYYAQFVLEDSTRHHQAIWSFLPKSDDDKSYKQDEKVAQIQYHTDLAELGLHFETDPADAPLAPWDNNATGIPGATTRCLVAKACPVFMIEHIFRDLRLLPFLLRSPHFRSQVEDIWLDNFGRDDEPVHGDAQQQRSRRGAFCDLHIWFTNTNAAMTTLNGCRFGVGAKLRCEPDPCASQHNLSSTWTAPGQQQQRVWHSHGNISLLTLSDHRVLDTVFQGWRKVHAASPGASTAARVQCCAGASGPRACSVSCSGQTANTRPNMNKVVVDQKFYTIPDLIQSTGAIHSAIKPAVMSPIPQDVNPLPAHPLPPLIQPDQDDNADAGESGPELDHKGNTSNLSSSRVESDDTRTRHPPAPTSPTYLSVLYNAALGAYRRSPTSHDLGTSFQIPTSAIDVLGGTDVDATNQKGPLQEVNAAVDSADPSLNSNDDNNGSGGSSSSEPSSNGAEITEQKQQQQQKYSLASLVSWSCDLDEFMAMSDQQWMAFGTVFYRPPPGLDTAERHSGVVFERVGE